MADFQFGADILQDVLFRSDEPATGSDYEAAAKRYINRVYWDVISWAAWAWAIKYPPGVFQTVAKVTGTATVTEGSTSVTLGATVATSMINRKFQIDNEGVPYRISAHTAGTAAVTLDAAYTESTGSALAFTIFQDEYQLSTLTIRPFSFWFRNRPQGRVTPVNDEEMRAKTWYISSVNQVFEIAMIDDQRVRIRPWTEDAITIEYDYVERQSALTFDSTSTDTPIVPEDDRHVLADWACHYLQTDKNMIEKASTNLIMTKNKLDKMFDKSFPSRRVRLHMRPGASAGYDT